MNIFSKNNEKDINIVTQNLSRLDRRQSELFESRIAILRDLCSVSLKCVDEDMPIIDKLHEAYSVALSGHTKKSTEDEFYLHIRSFLSSLSVMEKLELCREFVKTCGSAINDLELLIYADGSTQSDPIIPLSRGRIAYMKNNYTESAFLKFSKAVQNPRSAYQQSFDAVCEEVYSGRSEFCILPIENSAEGRLNSFYSMIDRYELKIAATCTIEQHDTQRFTKFALLKKSLLGSYLRHQTNSKSILEFKLSSALNEDSMNTESSPIGDILLAASASGMKLLRIDSMPLPYNDEMMAYYISLAVDGAELTPFLLYIALEFPQFDPLGVYFTVN